MLRRLIAVLILLITAAACVAVDAAIALSPGQLSKRLRKEARNVIAAPLDFESARFSFSDGLVIRGLQIGEPKKPAIAVRKATVRVNLWPLEVTEVVIEGPKVFLRVNPDGSTNFADLLAPQPAGTQAGGMKIPTIEVTGGEITAEAQLSPDDTVRATLREVSGSVRPDPASGRMVVSVHMLSTAMKQMSAEGSMTPDLNDGEFVVTVPSVEIASVEPVLPKEGRKLLKDLQLDGKLSLEARFAVTDGKVSFGATAKSLGCTAMYREFPALIEDVRGTVKVTSKGVQLIGITGCSYGNPVGMVGLIEFGDSTPRIELDIVAKGLKVSDELLATIPASERKVIKDFAPRGSADIRANIVKPAGSYKPLITVQVDVRGEASIAYFEFPYRLENLTGTLLITPERVEVRDVTSIMGSQEVVGSGHVVPSEDGLEVAVKIRGRRVRIDKHLREALTEDDREVWDLFSPSGTANLAVSINSPADAEEVSIGVEVLLDGFANVTPESFPVQISGITGTFSIVPEGGVRLTSVHGRAAGGEVRVADTEIPRGETSEASIDAVFSDVGLGRDMVNALASAIGENLEDLSAGGRTCGEIHLHRPEGSKEFALTGKVSVEDGWLVHKAFPVKTHDLRGTLHIKPGGYYLRSLTGKAAGGDLEAWGELLELPGEKQKLRLRIEGFGVLADGELRKSLPEDLHSTWDDFKPYGRADVAIWLDGLMPFEDMKKTLKLHLRDVSGSYSGFPYDVSGIAGDVRVDIDTGNVRIKDLRTADGRVTLSGTVLNDGNRTITNLDVVAREVTLDKVLRDAMPDEIKALWKDLELGGKASGKVKMRIDQTGEEEPVIDYDIELKPEDAQMEGGIPFRKLKGKVTFKGHVSAEGEHTLKRGLIQLRDFTASGLPVTWISIPVKLTEDYVTLKPITGRMANGTLSGLLKILFDKDSTFAGEFELKGASVRLAAQQLFGEKMDKTTGRANAWIRLQGKGSDDSSLRGKGEIRLSKSNLWEVPFFSALVKALSLGAVPSVDFTESYAHFRIKGDKLHFTEVRFRSPVMNLDGDGTLTFDGKIDFTFKISLISSILKFDPTGILHKIVSTVEGHLFAVRATGTAKKVLVEVAPKSVLDALKALEKKDKPEEDK